MKLTFYSLILVVSSMASNWYSLDAYPSDNPLAQPFTCEESDTLRNDLRQSLNDLLFMMPAINGNDSITYNVISGAPGFPTGTWDSESFSILLHSFSISEGVVYCNLGIKRQQNSLSFAKLVPTSPAPTGIVIEIDLIKISTFSTAPYFSYKLTGVQVVTGSSGGNDEGLPYSDTYTISASTIGFKNYLTGTNYAFDLANGIEVPY